MAQLISTNIAGSLTVTGTVDLESSLAVGGNVTVAGSLTVTGAMNHTHGNITNVGAIGSTANLPVITTTSGVLTVGSFGTAANTFCVGNDSRLSDARTPLSHTHGSITNAGAIGSTSTYVVFTTTGGVLTVSSALYYTGGTLYAGAFQSTSSRAMKENIHLSKTNALNTINDIKIYDYNFKTDSVPRVGFIAEDTTTLLSIDHKGMDHANCIGLLLKAVQELQAEITDIRKELKRV